VTFDHGPFSPRVLIQRAMETAVMPPSPGLKSVRKLGLVVMVRNVSAAGSVGFVHGDTIRIMPIPRCIAAIVSLIAAISFGGCAASQPSMAGERTTDSPVSPSKAMESHFHFRPASAPSGAWVVLLPGASGLTIFDDKDHYFRSANALNAQGFDVLVVDYKAAYKAAHNPPRVPTGSKIAWVTVQAVAWARTTGTIKAEQPGAIVAWSLGAEGLWPLLADAARVNALHLKAAAAYYPSNEDDAPLKTGTPLLILTGQKDDVTEAKQIHAMVSSAASPIVTLHVYPNANHGFDIASLTKPRTVRLLPLIGPSGTFGYDESASRSAAGELMAFLKEHMR
jgi:dienelactone hydrolase